MANFLDYLQKEGIDPNSEKAQFLSAIYGQESGAGRNTKTSNQGAVGGMQIIPSTFKSVADKDWNINNPEQSARAGIRYGSNLYDKYGAERAAVGYYSGPGGIKAYDKGIYYKDKKNPKAPDTREYAQSVLNRMGNVGSIEGGGAGGAGGAAKEEENPYDRPGVSNPMYQEYLQTLIDAGENPYDRPGTSNPLYYEYLQYKKDEELKKSQAPQPETPAQLEPGIEPSKTGDASLGFVGNSLLKGGAGAADMLLNTPGNIVRLVGAAYGYGAGELGYGSEKFPEVALPANTITDYLTKENYIKNAPEYNPTSGWGRTADMAIQSLPYGGGMKLATGALQPVAGLAKNLLTSPIVTTTAAKNLLTSPATIAKVQNLLNNPATIAKDLGSTAQNYLTSTAKNLGSTTKDVLTSTAKNLKTNPIATSKAALATLTGPTAKRLAATASLSGGTQGLIELGFNPWVASGIGIAAPFAVKGLSQVSPFLSNEAATKEAANRILRTTADIRNLKEPLPANYSQDMLTKLNTTLAERTPLTNPATKRPISTVGQLLKNEYLKDAEIAQSKKNLPLEDLSSNTAQWQRRAAQSNQEFKTLIRDIPENRFTKPKLKDIKEKINDPDSILTQKDLNKLEKFLKTSPIDKIKMDQAKYNNLLTTIEERKVVPSNTNTITTALDLSVKNYLNESRLFSMGLGAAGGAVYGGPSGALIGAITGALGRGALPMANKLLIKSNNAKLQAYITHQLLAPSKLVKAIEKMNKADAEKFIRKDYANFTSSQLPVLNNLQKNKKD